MKIHRKIIETLGIMVASAAFLSAVQSEQPLLVYEAASVKLNTAGGTKSSSKNTKGQIVLSNQTLRRLVERAYNVKPFAVSAPSWMDSVRVGIAAKYPPNTQTTDRAPMLRSLLEERFGLVVHRETKSLPGYVLSVAKSGFRLKPAEPGKEDLNTFGGKVVTIEAKKASMSALADEMTDELGQLVVDRTGVPGVFDFVVRWLRDDLGEPATGELATAPSISTAFQEALGVRVQAQKVPVEMVVVDRMERAPKD